ncbi:PREDICTED: uncharacterized protein LOC104598223 [Nelumbo nucifera]|uniref:Uncharacterized protein LOC104598223 n=1 Tax=Nelumbo nucifera TaxID=4432 RepID=A0A1U8A8Z7_NELNU|nr:PREDICTED: uncharacterized protein LOC104598223 [Nelumbo nucifera]
MTVAPHIPSLGIQEALPQSSLENRSNPSTYRRKIPSRGFPSNFLTPNFRISDATSRPLHRNPSQVLNRSITINLLQAGLNSDMGLAIDSGSSSTGQSHYHTHKVFLLCNYILLGAASSCIFLTLSLRLVPSLCGFLLILLHIFTIAGAISGCAAASEGTSRWYAAHMVATVLTAIFQGSVSVLIFTRSGEFLGDLKSYVREEDGVMILRLAGGLCVLIFCLEWVVLSLAFALRYYAYVEGEGGNGGSVKRSAKVHQGEDMNDWPWPFQV